MYYKVVKQIPGQIDSAGVLTLWQQRAADTNSFISQQTILELMAVEIFFATSCPGARSELYDLPGQARCWS